MRRASLPALLLPLWMAGCIQPPLDQDRTSPPSAEVTEGARRIHIEMRHEQGRILIQEISCVMAIGVEAFAYDGDWGKVEDLEKADRVHFVTEPTTCDSLFTLRAAYEKAGRTIVDQEITILVDEARTLVLIDQEYGHRFAIRAWTEMELPTDNSALKRLLELREKEELEDLRRKTEGEEKSKPGKW